MKRLLSILNLSISMLVITTAFLACGGDDETINPSPESPEALKAKHITRVEFQNSDGTIGSECLINYDSKGRVSSFYWRDGSDAYRYYYSYNESTIVENSGSGTTTFYLLNGRITSTDDYGFSYDSTGHLQSKSGNRRITYTWLNDNLTSYFRTYNNSGHTRETTMEYSDIKVPVNYIPYLFYWGYKFKFSENYPFLAYYGFLGENSRNLAKKMVQIVNEFAHPYTVLEEYEYVMKDGLPVEIIVDITTYGSTKTRNYADITNHYSKHIIVEWN